MSTSSRRFIQAATAPRSSALPSEGGYDRAGPGSASAAITTSGTGSPGEPMDRSTAPPGSADANRLNSSRRS